MHIRQLRILNFRSHLDFSAQELGAIVVIVGPNGSGKTNILEAISMLSPGRGMHYSESEKMLCFNQHIYTQWSVQAILDNNCELRTGATIANGKGSRSNYLDGEKLKNQKELLNLLRVIWLTPRMDDIFIAPASSRRRFLDRMTYNFRTDHATNVVKYDYYLRSRLKLLLSGNSDAVWLGQMEDKMSEYGLLIENARRKTIEHLSDICQQYTSEFLFPKISLHGLSPQLSYQEMSSILKDHRTEDRKRGRTHFGPHRSDLQAIHPDKGMPAGMCSAGEQKAMLISLILAQTRGIQDYCGKQPVVLLDELFAHLDQERIRHLLDLLHAVRAQVWMTTTEHRFDIHGEHVLRL